MSLDRPWRYLHVSVRDGIAVVGFRDPNDDTFVADRHPMHRELRDIFPALQDDQRVTAAVLAGAESSFCPFPSLEALDSLLSIRPEAAETLQREARQIVDNIIGFDKPLVAAVAADARGMGAQVALMCDFIVASQGVVFQDTHVRLGLASGDGATVIWPLILGLARARTHVLRGRPITASELYELGAVSELGNGPDDVFSRAHELAVKLAAQPQPAYRATKLALNQWLRLGSGLTLALASGLEVSTYESAEFRALREGARRAGGEARSADDAS